MNDDAKPMDNTNVADNQHIIINAFSKRFYTLRAVRLLNEFIKTINDLNNEQRNLKILSKHTSDKTRDHYLSHPVLKKILAFGKLAKQQAEDLLIKITAQNGNIITPAEQEYVDRMTIQPNDPNTEKRAEIESLLNQYAPDLAQSPEIYHTRLLFDYNPLTSSPSSSVVFNENIDYLRKKGLLNALNETTLVNNQSFDIRQLLTFDDYRLYLLQYYFNALRHDLSADNPHVEGNTVPELTPFDLLFNPKITITYSPEILAILHFRHQMQLNALTSFVTQFKKEAHQLLSESGEQIRQIDMRINALRMTLSALKSQQQQIESSLVQRVDSKKRSPVRHHDPSQRTTKIQAEINALKRQRALITNNTRLLNDYHRIAKLYVDTEKQFLQDLASYLLANKNEPGNTQAIKNLRDHLLQNDLTIKENHAQFRVTEKQHDPRFREKPFDTQNNQYTNYRKLWLDIIDNMFSLDKH